MIFNSNHVSTCTCFLPVARRNCAHFAAELHILWYYLLLIRCHGDEYVWKNMSICIAPN